MIKKKNLINNLRRIKLLEYRSNTTCHEDHVDMGKAIDRLIKRIEGGKDG